jgi:hypothetical protein
MSDFSNFNPQPKKGKKPKATKKPLPKRSKKNKPPTAEQRKRWNEIVKLGCAVKNWECTPRVITIHHCGTEAGGRKDHDKVIGLCFNHHLSKEYGIDGRGKYSKKTWQEHYGSEQHFLDITLKRIEDEKLKE